MLFIKYLLCHIPKPQTPNPRITCIPGWLQTQYVSKASLELLILLTLPPKDWGYRCVLLPLDVFIF